MLNFMEKYTLDFFRFLSDKEVFVIPAYSSQT